MLIVKIVIIYATCLKKTFLAKWCKFPYCLPRIVDDDIFQDSLLCFIQVMSDTRT
jgi:hypothetical protein